MAAIDQIFQAIKLRTYQNKVPWDTTASEDTFAAGIRDQSVTLTKSVFSLMFGDPTLLFSIFDSKGASLDSLSLKITNAGDLDDFFATVKRQALLIDAKLGLMLENLEQDN
ncbi:MAG: hypothetical protein FI703_05400 [SAR202 cluster bacterium]|nr:hypothetical protein [SAR202 cluster bacterium]